MPTRNGVWSSEWRTRRRASLERFGPGHGYLFKVRDADAGLMLSAELTLTEIMELREFIGKVARERVAEGRSHGKGE